MEHCPAARKPAHQVSSFFLQEIHPAFLPAVLVLANHHRMTVLPQEKDTGPIGHMGCHVFLHGQVPVRVCIICFQPDQPVNHSASFCGNTSYAVFPHDLLLPVTLLPVMLLPMTLLPVMLLPVMLLPVTSVTPDSRKPARTAFPAAQAGSLYRAFSFPGYPGRSFISCL